jgi:hypothetical protein
MASSFRPRRVRLDWRSRARLSLPMWRNFLEADFWPASLKVLFRGITSRLPVTREESQNEKSIRPFPAGSSRAVFELVLSLRDTNGIANSQAEDQASCRNIDERYEREAGGK